MITCRTVVARLWKLVGEAEPASDRRSLERHLEACPSCRAYLDGYRLTIHVCKRLHCPPLPDRLAWRLRELLEEERGSKKGESD
jgi:hypothetical protein